MYLCNIQLNIRKVIEAHFNERNTTDLWSKLTSQLPEQSSYSFVLRRIELTQKVLIASRKSYIKFGKPPPDKVFCTYLEGELSRLYVVQEIRHLLRTGVSDEALTTEVTKCRGKKKLYNIMGKGRLKKSKFTKMILQVSF